MRAKDTYEFWLGQATTALKDSIRHWERLGDNPDCNESTGSSDCSCCRQFAIGRTSPCSKCPIAIRADNALCRDTPYIVAVKAFEGWQDEKEGYDFENFQLLAKDEVTYLEETLRLVEAGEVKPRGCE